MLKEIKGLFKNPPKEYRPVPFWSWNDKLDPEFLAWQVVEMEKAGLGGYFMHARGGLETEYLSDEWMRCIGACVQEGMKTGMHSWIYDENGWPSGFAGGVVPAISDRYHGRFLKLEEISVEALGEDQADISAVSGYLGVYVIDEARREVYPAGRSPVRTAAGTINRTVIVKQCANPYYIDVCSREAVQAFLQCTHEKYFERFGEQFGSGIKGFFTDEPRLSGKVEGDVPWSMLLPGKFREEFGYDLLEVLPLLFLKYNGYEKVRYDFWKLVSRLFVTSFVEQIGRWCDEHQCMLTGHIMMEESIFTQMTGSGGVMPFYEYMHIPGVDWLRRMIGSPVVPKQVGSVACQLGKKHVLTESFALCGWDVNFEELKWIAEWQYVNGVNLMCQHLQGYTLRGLRKRDYPPSLFIQQSWWKEYSAFNDYLARLGVILTSGKCVADVLVLHPMHSGWILYEGSSDEPLRRLDADFVRASEALAGMHIDYHYGDETILALHGSVEDGLVVVGECRYKVVVLPSMYTLDSTTVKLLEDFLRQGGTIISVGEFPYLCDGRECPEMEGLKERAIHAGDSKERLYETVKWLGVSSVSISQEDGREIEDIHYQQRDIGDTKVFFLVNHSTEKTFFAHIRFYPDGKGGLPVKGKVRRLAAENGEIMELSFYRSGRGLAADMEFLPRQSCILMVETEAAEEVTAHEALPDKRTSFSILGNREHPEGTICVRCGPAWEIREMDLNAMTLDRCMYSVDGGPWEGPAAVIHLMDRLLKLRRSCEIAMKFEPVIDMDIRKNNEFYLVLERAEKFDIRVNGQKAAVGNAGWWKDSAFVKVDIRHHIINGRNEIVLRRRFYQSPHVYHVLFDEGVYETELNKLTYDVELENIYLVGDFGTASKTEFMAGDRKVLRTDGPFVITDPPSTLRSGSFTTQGLCFFAGRIVLRQTVRLEEAAGRRLLLDVGRPDAAMVKVHINGKPAGKLLWAPYTLDITDFAKAGENELVLEVFASNRNLLGPHHHINGELYSVGPASFTGKWSWAEKKTEAIPATEQERKASYWTEYYSFVRFGLHDIDML